jgi:drug/metabolite transporter (DMT)-like permease
MRSLIGAAVIALIFRKELRFTGSFEQIGAAVAYAGTVVLFVVANKLTTAANAILLQYTAPVYVALFSPWFLGERAQRNDWLSLAAIMVGMLLFFGDELSLERLSWQRRGAAQRVLLRLADPVSAPPPR